MTLVAPHILDRLRGRVSDKNFIVSKGANISLIADLIERAEKFDFGDLMLERDADGHLSIPRLTKEEERFFDQDLVPWPAPVVWYEYVIERERSGLLVRKGDTAVEVMRIDYSSHHHCYVTGIWIERLGGKGRFHGNEQVRFKSEIARKEVFCQLAGHWKMAEYLTLMLRSRSTEVSVDAEPTTLNAARIKRGRHPFPSHRVVNIVPDRYRQPGESINGNRQPPRLHWRRSHLRTLKSGKRIVIARMAVGRAELGEVSHEYQVKFSK